jgi:mono/diheme cytochrome c family protein
VLALAAAALACAADTPERQSARGAALYDRECRHCHDADGGIGVALSDPVIGSYGTAQRLFTYLRVAMPHGAPGSLDARAYWDVVAYLASNRGARAVPLILDSATAAGVSLAERQPPVP